MARRRTYDEHLAYIAGELPRWANISIGGGVLLLVAGAGGAVIAALAAVGAPEVVANGAGILTLVAGVAFALKRIDPWLHELQDRRSRRRRVTIGLQPTPCCPDQCECVEHLAARARAAEERAARAEQELARLRR